MDNNFNDGMTQQVPDMTQPYAQPYVQPDMGQPYVQPTEAQPYVQPDMSQQYVQPAEAQPYVQPETVQPYVQPETVQPYVQPETVQPQVAQPTEAQPYVQPEAAQPYVQPAEAQPYVQPTEAQPYVQPTETQQYAQPDMNQQFAQQQPDMNAQFGQQFAQPGMTPGMPPQPPVENGKKAKKQKAPKVKKPLTKGKIIGLVAGGVALVAAIICGIIFIPKLFKSDKDVVIDAFENTFAVSNSDSFMAEAFGSEDLAKKMEETGFSNSGSFSINSIGGENLGDNTISATYSSGYDPVNKELGYQMSVKLGDKDFMNIEFYADEENTYFGIPNVMDGYFTIPNKGALQAFVNSPIMEASGVKDQMGTMNVTGDLNYFPSEDGEVAINADVVKALDTIWDNVEFKKQGKAKVDVNGETVSTKEYYVTLGEKDIEEALSQMMDATVSAYAGTEAGAEMATYVSQVKSLIPTLVSGDLVVKVYIAKDKVVKIVLADDVNILGSKLSYDCYMDFGDDVCGQFEMSAAGEKVGIYYDIDDIKNAPTGEISIKAAGEEAKITIETKSADDDKKISKDMVLEFVMDGESYGKLGIKFDMDKDSLAFDCSGYYADQNGDKLCEVEGSGKYKDIVKGESFTFDWETFKVTIENEEIIDISTSATTTTNVTVPQIDKSAKMYDITTMTEEDFENLVLDNEDNIMQWLEDTGLQELFGNSSTDPEPVEPDPVETESANTLETFVASFNIMILGTIDGFTQSYDSSYFIDYSADSALIEYMCSEYSTVEDLQDENVYYEESEMLDRVTDQEITLSDGTTIKYSYYVINIFGDTNTIQYRFTREVGEDVILYADIRVNEGDYTVEQLAEALSESYFTLIQK